jgi:hypothetical protein
MITERVGLDEQKVNDPARCLYWCVTDASLRRDISRD